MKFTLSSVLLVLLTFWCNAQFSYNANRLIQDLEVLSADNMGGRKVGTDGGELARTLIVDRLKELGVKPFGSPDYLQPFQMTQSFGQVKTGNGTNILGVREGKKNQTIVISAHYDHVGTMNNKIYNGADDNASGVAALLAFAEYFQKNAPDHRLIFAFFDAEESGLRGSAHFVNTIDLEIENIVLNINMDMISRSDKRELYVCGTFYYPDLKKPLDKIVLPENMTLLFGHDDPSTGNNDWTNQSDHRNFHKKNIPFLYFGVEDHPDYHKPTDDFEKINVDFYSRSVESILRAILLLDKNLN